MLLTSILVSVVIDRTSCLWFDYNIDEKKFGDFTKKYLKVGAVSCTIKDINFI